MPVLRNLGRLIVHNRLKAFLFNESGATAIEYALLASLIAVAIIASITVIGTQLQNTFNEVSANLK
jgi:pilus assembly protein Flp/PilA